MKIASLFAALLAASICLAQPAGTNLYYGLLHAHTAFSDGSGTPEEAYAKAKSEKLDFFAVTPHNHIDAEDGAKERRDGLLVAKDHRLYSGTAKMDLTQQFSNGTKKNIKAKSVIASAQGATTSKFLALYGQEFSTISSGNHMNVFDLDSVITAPDGDFRSMFQTLEKIRASGKPIPVVQLNHANVQEDLFYKGASVKIKQEMFDDYGIDENDLGPNFKDWVKAVDDYVSLIEVLSGPAMAKEDQPHYHYKETHENDYYFYLTQGLHVSPSAGQDNHYPTWASSTPARTGVYAKSLQKQDILDAFRANRTFATEDKNMAIKFWLNDHFMGDTVPMKIDAELQFRFEISDEDDSAGVYKISLVGGIINPEDSKLATHTLASDGVLEEMEVSGTGGYQFKPLVMSGNRTFFYVKVEQIDEDRLWSAPIWVSPAVAPVEFGMGNAVAEYCWTTGNSKYYHLKNCPSVKLIKPENLRCGMEPPNLKTLHKCPVTEEEHGDH